MNPNPLDFGRLKACSRNYLREETIDKSRGQMIAVNVRRSVRNYLREREIIACIQALKKTCMQLNWYYGGTQFCPHPGIALKGYGGPESELPFGPIQTSFFNPTKPGVPASIQQNINQLEHELTWLRAQQVSHIPKMYKTEKMSGMAVFLRVEILGFIVAMDEMCQVFMSYMDKEILPSGKQFLVFYSNDNINVAEAIEGISKYRKNLPLCEKISKKHDQGYGLTNHILEIFRSGLLRGLFLPLSVKYDEDFLKALMPNVGYIVNFYLCFLVAHNSRSAYWERAESSKYTTDSCNVKIVDFIDSAPMEKTLFDKFYCENGFLFRWKDYNSFHKIVGKPSLLGEYVPPLPGPGLITIQPQVQLEPGTHVSAPVKIPLYRDPPGTRGIVYRNPVPQHIGFNYNALAPMIQFQDRSVRKRRYEEDWNRVLKTVVPEKEQRMQPSKESRLESEEVEESVSQSPKPEEAVSDSESEELVIAEAEVEDNGTDNEN